MSMLMNLISLKTRFNGLHASEDVRPFVLTQYRRVKDAPTDRRTERVAVA